MNYSKDMEIQRLTAELDAQKQESAWLKNIYERMTDTYYCADQDGRVLRVSPSGEALMGYTVDELIGRKLSDFYVDPSLRPSFIKHLIEAGGKLPYHEHQVRRKDGSIIWISTNAHLLYNEQHEIMGIEGMIRDVTEIKKMQESLFELKKYESMKGLIGGIAHYFNNDLAVVAGQIYLMKQRCMDTTGCHTAWMESAEKKIAHMAEIIQSLLSFIAYKSGSMQSVSLQQVVRASVNRVQKDAVHASLHVVLDMPEDDVLVRSIPSLLEKSIAHLFRNAAYAMRAQQDATIDVGMAEFQRNGKKWVRLRVCDTGEGMDEATIARVHEPFFTTKEIGQGEGLGISVVSGVVHQCGGSLQFESHVGEGTTVVMEMPVAIV